MYRSKHPMMLEKNPSVIITTNGDEKKIYENNKVFLNNGDNFEIRFFNPLQEKIGAEIIFNGQKKNDGLLVLRPGEDISLDRFLGESKKMLFDTYEIDGGNSDAVKAAEVNGLIEIKFYKEQIVDFSTTVYRTRGINYTNLNENNINLDGFNDVNYSADLNNTLSFFSQTSLSSTNTRSKKTLKKKLKETGRVEKGSVSSQKIENVDITFNTISFHDLTFQLTPNSLKSETVQEVRNYCTGCAYRIRKTTWEFCPKCGQKIND